MAHKILKATEVNIEKASRLIRNGGIVIFPTDTVYGLGGDVFNAEAMRKIFAVKGREKTKPLPVLIADFEQLKIVVREVPPLAKALIKKYWPGSLTIIFYKNRKVPAIVTASEEKIGVRWPRHRVAEMLIRMVGGPIVGTSANLSGEEPLTTVEKITQKLLANVDLVLDGGSSGGILASTVVDVTEKPPKVLRQGMIELDL